MNKLLEIFCETGGGMSSARVVMVFWNVAVGLAWLILSLKNEQLMPIDAGLLAALGIANGTKLVQKFAESTDPPKPS